MSANSDKGYAGERPVELLMQTRVASAYRPRAGQPKDKGDIEGLPFVISVKNWGRESLSLWVDDLEDMVIHARKQTGVVWHKRRGVAAPEGWYVSMSGRLFLPFMDAYLKCGPQ